MLPFWFGKYGKNSQHAGIVALLELISALQSHPNCREASWTCPFLPVKAIGGNLDWNPDGSVLHGSCSDIVNQIAKYHHDGGQAADLTQSYRLCVLSNRLKLWVWFWSLEKLLKSKKENSLEGVQGNSERQEVSALAALGWSQRKRSCYSASLVTERAVLWVCVAAHFWGKGWRALCANFWLSVQEEWWLTKMLEW